MSVSDLHPEELLDKDTRGALTASERAMLDAHLERCATCRFERASRDDFAADLAALERDEAPFTSELIALALQKGATTSPREGGVPEPGPSTDDATADIDADADAADRVPAPRRKRGPRVAWLLVAAALLAVSAAAAGPGGGARWLIGAVGFDAEVTERGPTGATTTAPAARGPGALAPPTTSPVAPPTAPAPIDTAPVPEPIAPKAEAARPAAPSADVALAPRAGSPSASRTLAAPARVAPAAPVAPVAALTAPAPSAVIPPAAPAPEGAAALFDEANAARTAGRYTRAIEMFQKLQTAHPSSREAHISHGTLGRLLLDRGDPAGALASFDAYERRGRGPLDESVIIGRATALERLGREGQARRAWADLLARFPGSPYADHARRQIEVQR